MRCSVGLLVCRQVYISCGLFEFTGLISRDILRIKRWDHALCAAMPSVGYQIRNIKHCIDCHVEYGRSRDYTGAAGTCSGRTTEESYRNVQAKGDSGYLRSTEYEVQ